MNSTVFWHLLWKEYRLQRSLWIAIAVLGFSIELWISAMHWFTDDPDQAGFLMVLYGAALVHAWIYAMGCGAVLFAAERENGTYDFQRALPVPSRQVFGVKVLFALLSTAALLGVLLVLAALVAGWTRPASETFQVQWGFIGFASLEVLAWTILFSLLLHGPLKAAILGVAGASFVTYYLLSQKLGGVTALGSRAMVVAIVALVDCVLGWRWFRDSTRSSSSWALWMSRLASHWPARGVPALPSRGTILGRLAWQHWRDSGWILGILGVLTALAALPAAMLPPYHAEPDSFHLSSSPAGQTQLVVYWSLWFLGTIAASLLGVYAFRVDQRGASYRFLADRGVPPRMVWLSRQLVWLCLVALGTMVFLLLLATIWAKAPDLNPARSPWRAETSFDLPLFHVGRVLLLVVLACALGQFCSMFLRSGILAAVFAVALSLVAVVWVCVMASFEMNWLWSVAPIPVALFLATWLRVPGWMAERSRLRNWLLPGLTLAVPALGLLTAVALVRAYEVPDVEPGFSLEEYSQPADPEAVKTAQMYLRALDLYASYTKDKHGPVELRTYARDSYALILEASRRPTCDFLSLSESPAFLERDRLRVDSLVQLAAYHAMDLTIDGELDEALDRWFVALELSARLRRRSPAGFYPVAFRYESLESSILRGLQDWAVRRGQSSQKVLDALRRLERFLAGFPGPNEPIQWEYWRARRVLLEHPARGVNEALVPFWLRSLPWERERTRRVLNQLTAAGLGVVNEVASAMAQGKNPRLERFSTTNYWDCLRYRNAQFRSTFLDNYYSWATVGDFGFVVGKYARAQTEWRTTCILLALQAWRLDHDGQLPKSLDMLKGKYLEEIPLDPCSGEPFHYCPEGWPTTPSPWQTDSWITRGPIKAGAPFLWSIGSKIQLESPSIVGPNVHRLRRYRIPEWRSRREPSCEEDLLVHGWAFPVPAMTPHREPK